MDDYTLPVEEISPKCDVILVVGSGEELRKFLVSSSVLCSTSSVFSKMLTPSYREGRVAHSSESPQEIPLLEDEPTAISDVCGMLHHNMQYVSKSKHCRVDPDPRFYLMMIP